MEPGPGSGGGWAQLRAIRKRLQTSDAMESESDVVVSVLITARDNVRHVAKALRSVLRQTMSSLEVLVVDDGSSDSTPTILRSMRDPRVVVRVFPDSEGISRRRNLLVQLARGRYVAPLDADDLWLPHRLERLLAVLESRPEVVVAGSDVLVVDGDDAVGGYQRVPRSDVAIRWWCFFTSPVVHSASLIRATAFEAGIRYDEAFPLAQDYDLWVKLLGLGRAVNVPEAHTLYRVHDAQATQRLAAARVAEQEQIGRRAIESFSPAGLARESARLAWQLGAGVAVEDPVLPEAIRAYRRLFQRFAQAHAGREGLGEARRIAATALLRRAGASASRSAWHLRRAALAIDPLVPVSAPGVRLVNLVNGVRSRRPAAREVGALADPV